MIVQGAVSRKSWHKDIIRKHQSTAIDDKICPTPVFAPDGEDAALQFLGLGQSKSQHGVECCLVAAEFQICSLSALYDHSRLPSVAFSLKLHRAIRNDRVLPWIKCNFLPGRQGRSQFVRVLLSCRLLGTQEAHDVGRASSSDPSGADGLLGEVHATEEGLEGGIGAWYRNQGREKNSELGVGSRGLHRSSDNHPHAGRPWQLLIDTLP